MGALNRSIEALPALSRDLAGLLDNLIEIHMVFVGRFPLGALKSHVIEWRGHVMQQDDVT